MKADCLKFMVCLLCALEAVGETPSVDLMYFLTVLMCCNLVMYMSVIVEQ